jgi:hypothetical protein
MEIYLVEHYRPGADAAGMRAEAAGLRDAAAQLDREGLSIRYLRSTIVPADEAFLSLFEASSEAAVCQAHVRADVRFERISAAIAAEPDLKEEP